MDMTATCPKCGYSLSGATASTCPECGVNVAAASMELLQGRAAERRSLMFTVPAVALAIFCWYVLLFELPHTNMLRINWPRFVTLIILPLLASITLAMIGFCHRTRRGKLAAVAALITAFIPLAMAASTVVRYYR